MVCAAIKDELANIENIAAGVMDTQDFISTILFIMYVLEISHNKINNVVSVLSPIQPPFNNM